jgi:hypothetical protein
MVVRFVIILHRLAAFHETDLPPGFKTPDTSQCAEVVIERAILLHHNDNVFHIGDAARPIVGGDLQRSCNAPGKGGAKRAGGQ